MFDLKLFVVLLTVCPQWTAHSLRHTLSIGLLIKEEDRAMQRNFEDVLRQKCSNDVHFKLWAEYLQSSPTSSITNRATMRLLENRVVTFVSSNFFPETILHSNTFHLPVINVGSFSQDVKNEANYGVNIEPDVFPAVIDVMRYYKWRRFTYLHDTDKYFKVWFDVHLLTSGTSAGAKVLEKVKEDISQAVRDLHNLEPENRNILLNVHPEIAEQIISRFYHQSEPPERIMFHFILMQPMEELFWSMPYSKELKITGFRFYNPESENVLRFFNSTNSSNPKPSKSLLYHDAATMLCDVFNHMSTRDIQNLMEPKYDIHSEKVEFEEGQNLTELYKKVLLPDGLTGVVHFDNNGYREYYKIDVLEVVSNRPQTSFTWTDKDGLNAISPVYSMPSNLILPNSSDDIFKRTLVISALLQEPYVMLKEQTTEGEAPQYYGYLIDLLELLLHYVHPGLKYEIRLVDYQRGGYGRYNDDKKEWVGMIGEVFHKRADLAVGDITITSARLQAVDFIPYQSLGIGMLLKKPRNVNSLTDNSAFLFLNGFTQTVWICVVVAYIVVSLSLYFFSRITRSDPKITIFGGLAHSFGAVFYRNYNAHTRIFSMRFLSAIWWMFTFFLAVLYISSMSSNIMVNLLGLRTIIERQNFLSRTSKSIFEEALKTGKPKIGLQGMGSTYAFFQKSKLAVYARYSEVLNNNPELIMHSYAEGIKRVKNSEGHFAFLMETTSGRYIVQKDCELYMPPGTFDAKQHGLAIQHESPLIAPFRQAMLRIQESGDMAKLDNKWWTKTCQDEEEDVLRLKNLGHTPLSLAQTGGIFYFLFVGIALAILIFAFEVWMRKKGKLHDILEDNQELANEERRDAPSL